MGEELVESLLLKVLGLTSLGVLIALLEICLEIADLV